MLTTISGAGTPFGRPAARFAYSVALLRAGYIAFNHAPGHSSKVRRDTLSEGDDDRPILYHASHYLSKFLHRFVVGAALESGSIFVQCDNAGLVNARDRMDGGVRSSLRSGKGDWAWPYAAASAEHQLDSGDLASSRADADHVGGSRTPLLAVARGGESLLTYRGVPLAHQPAGSGCRCRRWTRPYGDAFCAGLPGDGGFRECLGPDHWVAGRLQSVIGPGRAPCR